MIRQPTTTPKAMSSTHFTFFCNTIKSGKTEDIDKLKDLLGPVTLSRHMESYPTTVSSKVRSLTPTQIMNTFKTHSNVMEAHAALSNIGLLKLLIPNILWQNLSADQKQRIDDWHMDTIGYKRGTIFVLSSTTGFNDSEEYVSVPLLEIPHLRKDPTTLLSLVISPTNKGVFGKVRTPKKGHTVLTSPIGTVE